MFGNSQAVRRLWAIGLVVLGLALLAPAGALALQVSIGDSYSSGEGAGSYDSATRGWPAGNGCHRTARAWPRLLGVPDGAHLACSGAVTGDFYRSHKSGPDRASQLERLEAIVATQAPTRIFVTIGGNDLGFARIFGKCVLGSCLGSMGSEELVALRETVRPAVVAALLATKRAGGGAEVVLVGYPDVIPGAGEAQIGCRWLSAVERKRIRRLESRLDASQAEAAAAAGVRYLSIRPALDDHELCGPDPWVNWGADIFRGSVLKQEKGHPTYPGQRAIARFVSQQL